jgi:hypothetical protein
MTGTTPGQARCRYARCAAADAVVLIERGRPDMARRVLLAALELGTRHQAGLGTVVDDRQPEPPPAPVEPELPPTPPVVFTPDFLARFSNLGLLGRPTDPVLTARMAMLAYAARQREERLQAQAELLPAPAPERHAVARQEAQEAQPEPERGIPAPPATRPRTPLGRGKPHHTVTSKRQRQTVLAEALAKGRITAERAAELLKIRPQDVPAVAEGRVQMGPTAWARLLEALKPWD